MNASDYRARARFRLQGNWPTAILVTLVAGILGGASTAGGPGSLRLNLNLDALQNPAGLLSPLPPQAVQIFTGVLGLSVALILMVSFVMMAAALVLGGAIHLGYCRYLLNLLDGHQARFEDLFSQLRRFGAALCMNVIRSLVIFLGLLCLVVPGVIAMYGFSMAGFLMAEDPELSATAALGRSWALMKGRKMNLFLLELSFIGWAILSAFTFGIGSLLLTPYVNLSKAAFYRDLIPADRAHYTT